MCFVILRDLPFFWPFCEAYTRTRVTKLINDTMLKYKKINRSFQ